MNYYNAEAYIAGGALSLIVIACIFAFNIDAFTSEGIMGVFCAAICFAIPFIFIVPSIKLILKRRKIKRFGKAYPGRIICFYKPPFLFANGFTDCHYTVTYKKSDKVCIVRFRNSNLDRRLVDLSCIVYVLDNEEYVCGFRYNKIGENGIRIPRE